MDDRDVDELHRIWELKEKGAISEDEYGRLKARILGPAGNAGQTQTDQSDYGDPLSGTPSGISSESSNAKAAGIGCAVVGAIVLVVAAIGSGGTRNSTSNTMNVDENLVATDMNASDMNATDMNVIAASSENISEETSTYDGGLNLTGSQANAARSAQQYLSMTGFSRDGLIDQLSSSAGDGYSVEDATAAVDSLSVDWNENAARSARQYLNLSPFSCEGLIDQLSSSAGDKYTKEQATYGAQAAGAC